MPAIFLTGIWGKTIKIQGVVRILTLLGQGIQNIIVPKRTKFHSYCPVMDKEL